MILLLTVLAAGLAPQDAEKAVRESVDGFFAAVRKQDPEGASKFWSEDAPHYKSFGTRSAPVFLQPPKELPSEVEVPRVVVAGEVAYAWVRFKGRWGDDLTYADEKVTTWSVVFHKAGGAWKWWTQEPAAAELARALGASKDKAARAALLEPYRDLVGRRLVETLCDTASELGLTGRTAEGLKWVDAADDVAETLENPALKTACLMARGQVLIAVQRTREAVAPLGEARDRAEKSGDTSTQAEARMFLGACLVDVGRGDDALKELARARELAQPPDQLVTLAMSESFTGTACRKLGLFAEALQWLEKSRVRSKGVAGGSLEVLALSEIGQTRFEQGDLGGALPPLLEALEMAKTLQYLQFQGKVLMTIGGVHVAAGEPEKGLEYLGKALEMWDALGSDRMRGRIRVLMGAARATARDYSGAAEEYDAALTVLKKAGDLPACADAAYCRGVMLLQQGDFPAADQQMAQGLELCPREGFERLRFLLTVGRGTVLLEQRDWAKALELFESMLGKADPLGPSARVGVQAGMGRARAGRAGPGDLEAAADWLRKAAAGIEDMRRDLGEQTIQQSFFSRYAPVHYCLADVLVRQKKPAEAFASSEQAKARTLVDLLERSGSRIVKGLTEEERRDEERLEGAAGALVRRLDAARLTDERLDLEGQLDQARSAADEFRRRAFLRHPELKILRGRFEPATLAELNQSLFARNPGLGILSYFVGTDDVLLFVLRGGPKEAAVSIHRIPVPSAVLQEAVSDFWARCGKADGDYRPASRILYDALLKPAEAELAGVSHLVIVPDRMLHFLSFQALTDGEGRHVIERWSVSVAPSVTALQKMVELGERRRADPAGATVPLLAVGAPVMPPGFSDLLHARKEIEALARQFGVTALTGPEALESRVKEQLPKARRIHVATHGKVNEAQPIQSFVVLGRDDRDDGYLTARELADMDLRAEMIVLSACETGLGAWKGGEGVIGLTWAAVSAGVPTSLLSQWQVEDSSTSDLMTGFYQGLDAGGAGGRGRRAKAAALRDAQLKLLKDGKHAHPYFWAPFILMGDWRE